MKFILKRKLKDYDAWKKMVSEMDGLRKSHGSKGATVYRNAKDPNEVYMVFEWEDGKSYQNYLGLPEVKKAISDSGTFEVIEVSESFHLAE
jgi:quinol monooxygenase YgiN